MRVPLCVISALMMASCFDQEKSDTAQVDTEIQFGTAQVDTETRFEIAGVYDDVSVSERDPGVVVRTAMVNLRGGEYYVARGTDIPFVVSEVFQGNAVIDGSRFRSANLRYFSPQYQFSGGGSIDAVLDEETGQIVGSMNHLVSPEQVLAISPRGLYTGPPFRLDSVSVTRNNAASEPIQISALEGAYVGTLNSSGTMHSANVSVTNTGHLVISLGGDCEIEGSIEPTIGVGYIQAASSTECVGFSGIQYAGVVGRFGGTLIALLVDSGRETSLVLYF